MVRWKLERGAERRSRSGSKQPPRWDSERLSLLPRDERVAAFTELIDWNETFSFCWLSKHSQFIPKLCGIGWDLKRHFGEEPEWASSSTGSGHQRAFFWNDSEEQTWVRSPVGTVYLGVFLPFKKSRKLSGKWKYSSKLNKNHSRIKNKNWSRTEVWCETTKHWMQSDVFGETQQTPGGSERSLHSSLQFNQIQKSPRNGPEEEKRTFWAEARHHWVSSPITGSRSGTNCTWTWTHWELIGGFPLDQSDSWQRDSAHLLSVKIYTFSYFHENMSYNCKASK